MNYHWPHDLTYFDNVDFPTSILPQKNTKAPLLIGLLNS